MAKTAKSKSVAQLVQDLQRIPHTKLPAGVQVDTDLNARSAVAVLSIEQLYTIWLNGKLVRSLMQRNHKFRLESGRAKHVTSRLCLAHLDISIAYFEGQYELVDGNHRLTHWFLTPGARVPAKVQVTLKVPNSREEYLELYKSYDSPKSAKNKRDTLFSMMRMAGFADQLTSKFMQSCAFVTAFKNLTTGSSDEALFKSVQTYEKAILALDRHALPGRPKMPAGVVQAALSLYHREGDEELVKNYVKDFVLAYHVGRYNASAEVQETTFHIDRMSAEENGGKMGGEAFIQKTAQLVEAAFAEFKQGRTAKAVAAPKVVRKKAQKRA